MQRWQEQKEQKVAELLRTRRSFRKMADTWTTLAVQALSSGHSAYAKQKAAMYTKRAAQANLVIMSIGYGDLLDTAGNLVERVRRERREAEEYIADSISDA